MCKNSTITLKLIHTTTRVGFGAGVDVVEPDIDRSNSLLIYQNIASKTFTHSLGYRYGTRYRAVIQYSRNSMCCSGYAGTPPNCPRKYLLIIQYTSSYSYINFAHTLAVCSVCYNGGTCIAPETCSCISGWTGSTCNTGKLLSCGGII